MVAIETLLHEAHAGGLTVAADGDRLVLRGPRAADALARALLARKPAVLAHLAAANPAVAWRVAAMRARLPASGPLPFLTARETPRAVDGCRSCGEPVQHCSGGVTARCQPCVHAAQLVTAAYAGRAPPRTPGRPATGD